MSAIERQIQVSWPLRVCFTENVFAPENPALVNILSGRPVARVLVVLEDALAQARPEVEAQINAYFRAHAANVLLVRPPLFVSGGETAKNSQTLVNDLLSHINRHHLDRHAYVVAVGGGAMLDVVGFATAIAHRGLRLVRLPTTTLAQADSGVGVKNGLNAFGKKNFVGTFAPPFAVINDFQFIPTLTAESKRGGYVEALKVACIRDQAFFVQLEQDAERLAAFEPAAMQRLIRRCAELHLDHIATGGDPFEMGSARPLDFGHWAAHKLEQLSHFQLTHAQAVAIGIALDVIYARRIGMLSAPEAERILSLLQRLGFSLFACELLNADEANRLVLLAGLEEFREHLGGELTITLLTAIGRGVEVHAMNPEIVIQSIHELADRRPR
ncbi:MAG TPA: 3-dehydroquinate synthase [Verrucomicrobiae bacterium]